MISALRTTVAHLLMVALCVWALWVQTTFRIPGNAIFVLLPAASLGVLALQLVLMIKDGFAKINGEVPFAAWWRALERASGVLVRAFVLYSLFLFANGALDPSEFVERESEILEIVGDEIDFGPVAALPVSWARIRSWDDPRRVDRLLLTSLEKQYLSAGQAVVVQVRPGRFGLPWVYTVQQDEGRHYEAVLKQAPSARMARHRLIRFYIEHRRYADATRALDDYFVLYPDDYGFAQQMAKGLGGIGRYAEMLRILEPFVTRKPGYEVYTLTALAMTKVGRKQDAIRLLEQAIKMEPENWWAYYFIGYAHIGLGKPEAALAAFEKVKSIRPKFPEVDQELQRLGALVALQRRAMRPGGTLQ